MSPLPFIDAVLVIPISIQDVDNMLVNEHLAESKAYCMEFFRMTSIAMHLFSNSTRLMEGSSLPPQQPQLLPEHF